MLKCSDEGETARISERSRAFAWLMTALFPVSAELVAAEQPGDGQGRRAASSDVLVPANLCRKPAKLGSPKIPVDSWLPSCRGCIRQYVNTVYLGMRPWTRASVMADAGRVSNLIEDSEAAG